MLLSDRVGAMVSHRRPAGEGQLLRLPRSNALGVPNHRRKGVPPNNIATRGGGDGLFAGGPESAYLSYSTLLALIVFLPSFSETVPVTLPDLPLVQMSSWNFLWLSSSK